MGAGYGGAIDAYALRYMYGSPAKYCTGDGMFMQKLKTLLRKDRRMQTVLMVSIMVFIFALFSLSRVGVTNANLAIFVFVVCQFLMAMRFPRFVIFVIAFEVFIVGLAGSFWIAFTMPDSRSNLLEQVPNYLRWIMACLFFLGACFLSSECLRMSKRSPDAAKRNPG